MKPIRSPESWIDDYRALKSKSSKKLFLIVEGPTDKELFRSIFPQDKVLVDSYPPPKSDCSKEHVINIANIAHSEKKNEIYGFVDLDFDVFLGKKINNNPQLLYTIESCIEIEYLKSKAYESFIKKIVKEKQIESATVQALQMLETIKTECSKIGQMRVGALKLGKDVEFKKISYEDKIDAKYSLDEEAIYQLLEEKEWIKPLSKEVFKAECKKVTSANLWTLCQGHDSTWFLWYLCNKMLKKKFTKDAERLLVRDRECTESTLRSCFTKDIFKQTALYNNCFKPILDGANISI